MGVEGLIDSHAHLYDRKFESDLGDVLERARSAGVLFCIVPGDRLETSREAAKLSILHSEIYCAVGFHPHESKDFSEGALDELRRMLEEPKTVAIGEIGLDYHYDYSPRDVQRKVFRTQLRLAKEAGLPVIMHCREAYEDFIAILGEEKAGLRGVCHCFSGTEEDAKSILDMDLSISFAGPITFAKADSLRRIASKVPLDRMLLETDSPYLAPEPVRGRRNEPAYVVHNAAKIAEIHGVSVKEVAEITTRNVRSLFRIEG